MKSRLTNTPEGADRDDASFWMMKKMSGKMSPHDQEALANWLNESPANAAALAELERLVQGVEQHGDLLLAAEFERELEEASAYRNDSWMSVRNIAATIMIAGAATIIALFVAPQYAHSPDSYQTAIGQYQEIALDDGSEVELNTASSIQVAYNAKRRAVGLDSGEAFFNVEKDKSRPFIVKTNYAEISVTGTSFSVSSDAQGSSVHVLTGVVDVKPLRGQSSTLLAGDMVNIGKDGYASDVRRYDPALVLAWRGGKARFREEPLEAVLVSLNRYFDTPIELGDKELAKLPVTGEFDIRDRDTAVRALTLAFDLESRTESSRVILNRRESE